MSETGTLEAERWSLSRAIDAMGAAARQAGRPGLVWLAGLVYPDWYVGWASVGTDGDVDVGEMVALLLLLPLLPLLQRLAAGLARISPPVVWERVRGAARPQPGLGDAWHAGRGLTWEALGLWALIHASLLAVALACFGPVLILDEAVRLERELVAFLLLGAGLFFTVYALVISVLHQLGLHSLVHNRRGVGSALQHAWRIVKSDPRAAFQAAVADVVLALSVYALQVALDAVLGWFPPVSWTLAMALVGFVGVARAAYWARAYRALGGLSPDDGVPGL